MSNIVTNLETFCVSNDATNQSSEISREADENRFSAQQKDDVIKGSEKKEESNSCEDTSSTAILTQGTATPVDIELTKITKHSGYISKTIRLEGELPRSDGSDCKMSHGTGHRIRFQDLGELGNFISTLEPSCAITLGRMKDSLPETVIIETQYSRNIDNRKTISRSKENFGYAVGKQALLLIDFDTKGMPEPTKEYIKSLGGIDKFFESVFPEIGKTAKIIRNSTSSGIYNQETGYEYEGSEGVHIYLVVQDGSDIPRALESIHKYLWLDGYGWIVVSKIYTCLVRSPADRSVSSPERLCFEGAPNIEPPLAQRTRPCRVLHGEVLDTRAVFPDLTLDQEKQYQKLVNEAKSLLEPNLVLLREKQINKEVDEGANRGYDRARVQKNVERKYRSNSEVCELLPTETLFFDDASLAKKNVEDVLSNPDLYHEKTLADPIEPYDSRGNIVRNKAILYVADNSIIIYSHKHGGRNYVLLHDASSIEKIIDEGKKNDLKLCNKIIKAMLMTGRSGLSKIEEDILVAKVTQHTGCGKKTFKADFNREKKKYISRQSALPSLTDSQSNMSTDSEYSDKILLECPGDYTKTAEIFLHKRYTDSNGNKTILYAAQQYYTYNGDCYQPIPEKSELIQGQVWRFAREECHVEDDPEGGTDSRPYLPSMSIQSNICAALKSIIGRNEPLDPTWLDGKIDQDIGYLLVLENGILNLKTGEFKPKTPNLFVLSSADYAFDPIAECLVFDAFLKSLKLDRESIELIEEMLGYALTTDRSFHKIFMIYGPPRSGKGTLLRIFDMLTNSFVAASLSMMDERFAFQSAIGKKVLAIPDARKGAKTDITAINEAFLSISGGDKQTINRKNLPYWTGYLNLLIIFAANQLLDFQDTSGALASRMLVLNLTESFLGQEDLNLTEKLMAERSGILNRAITGLKRLLARKRFLQPQASKPRLVAQTNKNDPNTAFVDEFCMLGPNFVIETSSFYDAYLRFVAVNKINNYYTNNIFGRDFLSRYNVSAREARQNEREKLKIDKPRARVYVGIALKPDWRERMADLEGGVTFSWADVPF